MEGYESKGTAEKNINDDSAGENLREMCKDKNTQVSQTPTNSGNQNLKVNTHHPSGHCDDPDVNTPSTSIPRVSSHQRCSACNVITACNVNSDASNYSIAKHVFIDAEPGPSNSGGHERVGSTHDENSHTSSLKSYGTERIGSHAQARNTKHMTKEEMMSRIKVCIAVGGDNSDSESENCDPRELALPPIMYRDRRKICFLMRQESSDSDSDSESSPSGEQTKKTDDVISEGYRLVLDKTNCPAAYCKVRVEGNISELTSAMGQALTPRGVVSKRKAAKCIVEKEGKHWLSSERAIQTLLDLPPYWVKEIIQGPSGSPFKDQWDAVPGLICSGPLPEIQNFLKRPRSGSWPSETDLGRIANMPAVLVATGHKFSNQKELEWRYSVCLSYFWQSICRPG